HLRRASSTPYSIAYSANQTSCASSTLWARSRSMRFANLLFEPIWDRTYIRSMQITLAESFGVQGGAVTFTKRRARERARSIEPCSVSPESGGGHRAGCARQTFGRRDDRRR